MRCANRVQTCFDVLHVLDIFDRTLSVASNDQALLAVHEGNLRDLLNRHKAEVILGLRADIDKGPQAIVLTEVASRLFVAGGTVLNLTHCVEADECGSLAIAPEPQRFLSCANRAGLSAMLMNDDFRLLAGCTKAIADEIHHCFYNCEIVLRSTL